MSAPTFELAPALEAGEPPEARGLARDAVRLMVARRGADEIVHARFRDLPDHLRAGDLLVVNVSATLPSAVSATRAGGDAIEVRFATRAPSPAHTDELVIELRGAGGIEPLDDGRVGERLRLPEGARIELLGHYAGGDRLWLARTPIAACLHEYLARHGRPIRYGYVPRPWPLSDYQTAFAAVAGSAEMPSAARPFTAELVTRLVVDGVLFAPLLLHTGVSSPERHEPPYPEFYDVPPATARVVNAVRGWGGRVIAVGTTPTRALETVATRDGTVGAGRGWTDLVISPERGVRAIDGLLTGWHEPAASHLQILEAIAGETFVAECYASALEHRYLWHEFGDSHLILP